VTLVMSASISGQFVVMTSDTRRVNKKYWYDLVTGEFEEVQNESLVISDEKSIKTFKLSEYVLVGAGGTAELAEYIIEQLKNEVKPEDDLAVCKQALERVIQREKNNKEGPRYLSFLNQKKGLTIILNGFYRDASTGLVTFEAGRDSEISETKAPKGSYQYSMITPAEEYMKRIHELFHIPKLNDEKTFENASAKEIRDIVYQTIIDHLATLHSIISYNHPVEVSPDVEFHVIALDENGFLSYGKNTFDFTETHKYYDEIAGESRS
jgi:hypothetical protein